MAAFSVLGGNKNCVTAYVRRRWSGSTDLMSMRGPSAEELGDQHLIIRRDCHSDPCLLVSPVENVSPMAGTVHPPADARPGNLFETVPFECHLLTNDRHPIVQIVLE